MAAGAVASTRAFAQAADAGGSPALTEIATKTGAATATISRTSDPPDGTLEIVGTNDGQSPSDFLFELGDVLRLKATGDLATAIAAELAKSAATRSITLYLDSVPMVGLVAGPLAVGQGQTASVHLSFSLARNPNNEDNRKAWDTLFRRQHSYVMPMPVSLAVGRALPIGATTPDSIQFQVATPFVTMLIFAVGLAVFVGMFAALIKWKRINAILLNATTGYYSLGKAQMAFWGLLVFVAVSGILVLTGTLECIPAQTLTLLGISGSTGLGSVLINRSKRVDAGNSIKHLADEEQQLLKDAATAAGTLAQSGIDRLRIVQTEMKRLGTLFVQGTSRGFFADICDDGNGPSFHRVQVVIWTILLGCAFVNSVVRVMSMPEFPESLLLLMGISNGTYLGFKVPEKD
jgi:hypothetical protein